MARPNSTVIVLVGAVVPGVFAELDRLANVRAAQIDRNAGESAPAFAASSHATYAVHDDDPLAPLGAAWAGFFDESAPAGTIEVALESTVRGFARGELELPDYYLVLDPDSLPVTQKNWWFGALAGIAPSRVVPSGASAASVQNAISALPTGRWWPEPVGDWMRSLTRVVPDDRALLRPGGSATAGGDLPL